MAPKCYTERGGFGHLVAEDSPLERISGAPLVVKPSSRHYICIWCLMFYLEAGDSKEENLEGKINMPKETPIMVHLCFV